jgi:hypothetical protein
MSANTQSEAVAVATPPEEPTVLMWSHSQNCLHIEPLSWMLDSNRRAYVADRQMDYVPLFVGPEDQCDAAAETMRQTLVQREALREKARDTVDAMRQKAAS